MSRSRPHGRTALAASLALLIASATLPTRADPTSADIATSRSLFDEGRALMKKGKYAEACPKLEEGVRLNPGVGMKYNLAECWEHVGKTASAWAMYLDAAAGAKTQKQGVKEKLARDAAKKLEAKLSRITIQLDDGADVPGLEVKRNGTLVGAGQLGVAVPVDPGTYTIEASAPDHEPWESKAEVAPDGDKVLVKVPKLAESKKAPPPPPPAPPPAPPPKGGMSATKIAGLAVAGVGLITAGIGLYFGAHAMSLKSQSNDHCAGNACDQQGFDLRTDARSAGNASTILVVVGGVALVSGVGLFLLAPSPSARDQARVAPAVGPGFAGLSFTGAF